MQLTVSGFFLGILAALALEDLPGPVWCAGLLLIVPAACLIRRLRLPLAIAAGFLWAVLQANVILSSSVDPAWEGRDVLVEGVIDALPEVRERGLRFVFEVQSLQHGGEAQPIPGRVLLTWYGDAPPLRVGERWRLLARLKRPHGFMNPGGFDYEGWLFRNRIRGTGYVVEAPINRRIEDGALRGALDCTRQRLQAAIAAALPDSANLGIITALAIGVRQAITPPQWQLLTATGTNHLVAISGLHIGLVAGLAFFLAQWLWRLTGLPRTLWPAKRIAALCALAAALGYAALAGFSIPTQRALIMVAVAMAGIWLQRSIDPFDLLALALGAVLLYDPFAAMAAGFWLSFAAVALILFGMGGRLHPAGAWWRWWRVHWVVGLGLAPLLLLLFQQAAGLAPLANALAVPVVSLVVVPLTLAGGALLGTLPGIGGALLQGADLALELLWPALAWLAAIEGDGWLRHAPPAWTLLPAALGIALLLAPHGLPGRWLGGILVLPLLLMRPAGPAAGELWLSVLDVGQGLAVVARTQHHTLVYDTGPRYSAVFDAGDAVLVPFLRQGGVGRVDTLMISHADNDHAGGAPSLAAQLPVGELLTSDPAALGLPGARPCAAGQGWEWDGVRFAVLFPPRDDSLVPAENNRSCVLQISAPGGRVLLTGDIERDAEAVLLDTLPAELAAQIVVAPHHGSTTSSTPDFVRAVAPAYAVFSVGYRNRYRFPKPQVVARYREQGAALLDTARLGAIGFALGAHGAAPVVSSHREAVRRFWHGR